MQAYEQIPDSENMELESLPTSSRVEFPAGEVIRQVGVWLSQQHPEITIKLENPCNWKDALLQVTLKLSDENIIGDIELKPMTPVQKEILQQMRLENIREDRETGWRCDLRDAERMIMATPSSCPSLASESICSSDSSSSFLSARAPTRYRPREQQEDPSPPQSDVVPATPQPVCSQCDTDRKWLKAKVTEAASGHPETRSQISNWFTLSLILLFLLFLLGSRRTDTVINTCSIPKDALLRCEEKA